MQTVRYFDFKGIQLDTNILWFNPVTHHADCVSSGTKHQLHTVTMVLVVLV